MDYPSYLALFHYLKDGNYPTGATETVKRRIRDQASRYTLVDLVIYGKTQNPEERGPELLHEGNIGEVIERVHQEGHFGVNKTWQRIRVQYDGPKLYDRVKTYVKGCQTCQFRRRKPRRRYAQARPIQTPSSPFFMIGCDAVGPTLERTRRGNRYLLVAVDYLTRWPVAAAVPDINETTTEQFLFDHVVTNFGVPNYILTDRGSNFTSGYVQEFLRKLGCRHLTTTAYRPQTNGLCERMNQTLVQTIAKLARDRNSSSRWDEFVNAALLAIRTMPNESTKFSPAMLLYGYELRTPAIWPAPRRDYVEGEIEREVTSRLKAIQHMTDTSRQEAREHVEQQQKRDKRRYDQFVAPRRRFGIGEQVLMRDQHPESKFSDRWLGPYTVTRVNKHGTYLLAGPSSRRIQHAVHDDMLISYHRRASFVPDLPVQRAHEQLNSWINRTRQD